ncbi:MAG: PQQ-binding-like beta-propeller repeat protein [Dehalococcoidia bacterium]|nr:PQQ-binding-like beta-propeller repeat protein [Dehalococcoidia bacterium]
MAYAWGRVALHAALPGAKAGMTLFLRNIHEESLVKEANLKKKILAVLGVLMLMLVMFSSCSSGAGAVGWAGVAMYDGSIFTVSGSGQLNVISPSDPTKDWAVAISESSDPGFLGCAPASVNIAVYGTPAVAGNYVYVAAYNGKIYVYDLTTHQLVKEAVVLDKDNNQTIVGAPIVSDGVLYIASSNGNVYALDANSLNLDRIWKFETKSKIWSTPVLSNGVLFIGSFDKNIYALDAASGEKKWSKSIGGAMMATPLVASGVVYAVSLDCSIYAFDEQTGDLKWKYPLDGQNDKKPSEWLWATPVLCEGFLYAPCMDGRVYAVNVASPSNVKVFDLDSPISAAPVVSDGKVVVASEKGRVYTLDATSGDKGTQRLVLDLRVSDNQPSLTVNSQLCAADGIVYVHSLRPDIVYVVNIEAATFRRFAMEAVSANSAGTTVTVTETVTVPTTVTVTN